jgi:TonB family protein
MWAPAERGLAALRRRSPAEKGWAASVLLHAVLWGFFSWTHSVRLNDEALSALEIDLSRPFRITDDPSKARQALNPGAGAPVVNAPTMAPGKGVVGGAEDAAPDAKGPAKDWVLPTEKTTQLEPPSTGEAAGRPDGEGEGAGLGGLGGEGDGEVDWVYLTELPKLLNRDRLLKDLRRFYPEPERQAGREGLVVLDVHVNAAGQVVRVSVVTTGGALFDEAARKVLSRARFAPAKVGPRPVPVKVRQSLDFRLE